MWIQDFDGDRYRVGDAFDGDRDLTIAGIDYPRAEVAKLRDHLNTLLVDAPAAKAETVAVEVGREYRLLPGSKYVAGTDCVFVDDRATRVRVVRGLDMDGDVYVKALDGDDPGFSAHVDPKYLAPLTEEPANPSPDVAQAARTIADRLDERHHPISAIAFRQFADLLEGKSL